MKIPHTIFDHGVGADWEEVHIHAVDTPDGVFVTDGCVLVRVDWCDDTVRQRVRYNDARQVDRAWWQSTVRTRTTNLVDDYPQVTIRPWYHLCLAEAGANMRWRSSRSEALIALEDDRTVVAVVAGWRSPYTPASLDSHPAEVRYLMGLYERHAPTLHPHLAAVAALIAVDEREGAPAQQTEIGMETTG